MGNENAKVARNMEALHRIHLTVGTTPRSLRQNIQHLCVGVNASSARAHPKWIAAMTKTRKARPGTNQWEKHNSIREKVIFWKKIVSNQS